MSSIHETGYQKDRGANAQTADAAIPSSTVSRQSAEALGKVLASLFRGFTLYPANHPSIVDGANKLLDLLAGFFAEADRVTVGFLGQDLLVLGKQLHHIEGSVPGLNELFQAQHVEKLRFVAGVTADEIGGFFTSFLKDTEESVNDQAVSLQELNQWPHIKVSQIRIGAVPVDLENQGTAINVDEAGVVREFLEACQGMVSDIQESSLIDFNLAGEIIDNILSGVILEDQAIPIIAQLREHDAYTFTHVLNVSTLTLAVGRVLGFSQDQLRELGLAALLHDTGKLFIPQEILQKKGSLTREEFELVQKHPVRGASFLMKEPGIPDLVPIVAFEHHMLAGGVGYPRIRSKRKPHLCSRMTTIADIFDALRTNRAYRNETPKDKTFQQMANMRVDPFLLNLFARIADIYSLGEFVRLDSHEIGVVHELNPRNAFRPKVKMLCDPDGKKFPEPRIVNLSHYDRKKKRFIHSIASVVSEEEAAKLV